MQIFTISNNHNFNISCINNDDIYNVQDNRIFKRNIYDFDNPIPFSDPLKEEPIGIFYISSLILVFKDKIFFYENEQVTKIEIFNDPILKIKQYKSKILILTSKNINIINNRNINILNINNIKDFCCNQDFTFILDNLGFIFKTFSILFTNSLNLRKPMKIIPEPNGKPISIFNNDNFIYLCYNKFIEVYNINDNILNLIYKYNTNNYKIIEEDKIYCLDKTLNLLGEYPKVIINNLIENKIGKVCLSKGKMYVIASEEEGGSSKVGGYNEDKGKERDYNGISSNGMGYNGISSKEDKGTLSRSPSSIPSSSPLSSSLVNLLFSLRSDFLIKSNSNKESILKDFDSLILDKYRRFYLELSTINDSILEKKKILDKSEIKILEKINKIDKKKIEILEKFKKKMEKYNEILRKTKINGKEINKNYEELKRKLKEKQEKSKFREELVIQRNLLTRKML